MIKLQGHTLTPVDLFSPESMALTITERSSTAQITQGLDAPSLQAGDWLLDPTDPGAGIVWRVKTADSVYSGRTVTYTLEHIIQTLRDIAMFGEVKPDTITGIEGAETCTARQAAEYVLSRQDSLSLESTFEINILSVRLPVVQIRFYQPFAHSDRRESYELAASLKLLPRHYSINLLPKESY